MDKPVLAIIAVIFLSLIGVAGDFFIKLSGSGQKFMDLKLFSIGFLVYTLTAFGWFLVMKQIKLATLGVFYAVSTTIFLAAIGLFYFKESLNFYEITGIVLAIISLVLLGKFA